MKTMFRMVFCLLLLTGWGLAALSLHVVRTPTAIGLIPKNRLGIIDTYVDTRHWTMADAAEHPLVVQRVVDTGQSDLLRHITGEDGDDLKGRLIDSVKHPQKYETTTRASSRNNRHGDLTSTATAATNAVKEWWDLR